MRLATATVLTLMMLLLGAGRADALPKNFRNVDIFYVGGMPSAADIDELQTLGVRTVISLHRLDRDVAKAARTRGMTLYAFPLRTRLVRADEMMQIIEQAPPGSVYLHCKHGADRTGAVAAYWLTTRRGYDPLTALAQVISPKKYHVAGLVMLAREYSMTLDPQATDLIGRYSGARNGGLEGLKVRGNEWYSRLARNYLEQTMGPPLVQPSDKFWGYDVDAH